MRSFLVDKQKNHCMIVRDIKFKKKMYRQKIPKKAGCLCYDGAQRKEIDQTGRN